MLRLLVAYTTYDGYTAKIAERIAATLRSAHCAVEVCDIARSKPEQSLEGYDGVIPGGPLHPNASPCYANRHWREIEHIPTKRSQ